MVTNSNAETVLCQVMIIRTVAKKFLGFAIARKRDIESGGIMKMRIIAIVIVALGIFGACSAEGQALRDVFKRVSSSVVVIRAVETNVIAGPPSQPAIAGGLGSGVLISTDGEIMTAAHLVETADSVFVQFSNQEIFKAKVIASEPAADVALLKLNSPPAFGSNGGATGRFRQS
jgi:S1-C subfamily serine protease